MTKFIALLIGLSLAFAAVAQAKPAQENPKNKKSKPDQQEQVAPKQQVAPRQNKAPNRQMQAMPKQPQVVPNAPKVQAEQPKNKKAPGAIIYSATHDNDLSRVKPNKVTSKPNKPTQDNARVRQKKGTEQNLTALPSEVRPNKPELRSNKPEIRPNKPVVQPNTLPAVQSDKLKANKTVKTFQPKHLNFKAKVNPSVASVQFNQDFRIRNAENWRGDHYNVFRTYRPQWHDRDWWSSNHSHIVLIGGGWYYWNSGYWYPAWGYDDSAAYYPYDGPIYVGSNPRPFDQVVADVQSILQEQGYYRGEVDGLVGPLTQEALAAYQSSQGLEPTAAIDQPTLESLGIT